jgi:hypothetical protein
MVEIAKTNEAEHRGQARESHSDYNLKSGNEVSDEVCTVLLWEEISSLHHSKGRLRDVFERSARAWPE